MAKKGKSITVKASENLGWYNDAGGLTKKGVIEVLRISDSETKLFNLNKKLDSIRPPKKEINIVSEGYNDFYKDESFLIKTTIVTETEDRFKRSEKLYEVPRTDLFFFLGAFWSDQIIEFKWTHRETKAEVNFKSK